MTEEEINLIKYSINKYYRYDSMWDCVLIGVLHRKVEVLFPCYFSCSFAKKNANVNIHCAKKNP